VLRLYEAHGYTGGATADDVLFVAESLDELVGVVRRTVEHGTTMLRGMQVATAHQRRGIGTRLLWGFVADLPAGVDCLCVPYAHLVGFYGAVDFELLSEDDAPAFLRERAAGYRARGLDVVIMRRAPAPTQPA
jgi:hypothetical protein